MKLIYPLSVLIIILSSCKVYVDDEFNNGKEPLPHISAYYNSVPDWTILDINNNQLNYKPTEFDREGKILKVDITINSKKPQRGEVLMWYGGDSNTIYNGETPISSQPMALVNMINLAEINKEYKIYPPQNNSYKAWSISYEPISKYDISKSNSIYKPSLDINLYLEPKTTLSITVKNIYIINKENSFIEHKKVKRYGIFGNIYDRIKFSQEKTYRRIFIKAQSKFDNSIIDIDSDFLNVKTEYF